MTQAIVDRSTRLCTATKADGTPCLSFALPKYGTCIAHTPEMREKAAESRRQGGLGRSTAARARKAVPADLKALRDRLLQAIEQVHQGELDPRRLTAMAGGASAVVKLHEIGELQARLDEIEGRLEQ